MRLAVIFLLLFAVPANAQIAVTDLTCGVMPGDRIAGDSGAVLKKLAANGCRGNVDILHNDGSGNMTVSVEDGPDIIVRNGKVSEIFLPGLLFDVSGSQNRWKESVQKQIGSGENGFLYEMLADEWTVRIARKK